MPRPPVANRFPALTFNFYQYHQVNSEGCLFFSLRTRAERAARRQARSPLCTRVYIRMYTRRRPVCSELYRETCTHSALYSRSSYCREETSGPHTERRLESQRDLGKARSVLSSLSYQRVGVKSKEEEDSSSASETKEASLTSLHLRMSASELTANRTPSRSVPGHSHSLDSSLPIRIELSPYTCVPATYMYTLPHIQTHAHST